MASLLLHQQIIFDTCVYVKDKQKHGDVLKVLSKKLKKFRLRAAVPEIVLNEISKVTKDSREKISEKVNNAFNGFTVIHCNEEIKIEARRLEEKYFDCHNPDSIILATAKIHGAILVTLDSKLLRIAQFEGVDSHHLSDFMKFWRIQVDY